MSRVHISDDWTTGVISDPRTLVVAKRQHELTPGCGSQAELGVRVQRI